MSDFDKAIDLLREQGWVRGNLHNSSGYCSLGALYTAHGMDLNTAEEYCQTPAVVALARAINQDRAQGEDTDYAELVYEWNDLEAKDVDDVIHMMKRADEILSEETV